MNSIYKSLQNKFQLDIEAPFTIKVGSEVHQFQCLIKGYGAENGMVIDKDWDKIAVIQDELIKSGYGFSCLELSDSTGFQEILNDWGKSNP